MKIAISGPMCSGKSTLAKLICGLNDDYKIYSFGQKIKDLAKELFDMRDIKDRSLLINIANSMKEINQNVWINYILKECKNNENCIIDDLRFKNELEFIQKLNGKVIQVVAPIRQQNNLINQNKNILNHRSEMELKDFNFEFRIDNDYNDNLENDLLKLLSIF